MDAETHAQLRRLNDAYTMLMRPTFGVQDAPGRGGIPLYRPNAVPPPPQRLPIHATPSHATPTMPPPIRNDPEYVQRSQQRRPNMVGDMCGARECTAQGWVSNPAWMVSLSTASLTLNRVSGFLPTVGRVLGDEWLQWGGCGSLDRTDLRTSSERS